MYIPHPTAPKGRLVTRILGIYGTADRRISVARLRGQAVAIDRQARAYLAGINPGLATPGREDGTEIGWFSLVCRLAVQRPTLFTLELHFDGKTELPTERQTIYPRIYS